MDTRVINVVSVKPSPGSPFYVQERHTLAFNLFGQADVGPAVWGNIVTYTPTAPTMDVAIWTRSSGGVRNLKHQQALTAGQEMRYTFGAPFQITEKTDVFLRATSSVNNADVCGGFDIVLVTN